MAGFSCVVEHQNRHTGFVNQSFQIAYRLVFGFVALGITRALHLGEGVDNDKVSFVGIDLALKLIQSSLIETVQRAFVV